MPVAAGSKVCWNCGLESCRDMDVLSVVSAVCCQVEISARSRSLVQRSPTECVIVMQVQQ
jgi:hypothetical protein